MKDGNSAKGGPKSGAKQDEYVKNLGGMPEKKNVDQIDSATRPKSKKSA